MTLTLCLPSLKTKDTAFGHARSISRVLAGSDIYIAYLESGRDLKGYLSGSLKGAGENKATTDPIGG